MRMRCLCLQDLWMVWKDGASWLCQFSRSGLTGGDDTTVVLLQNTDTMSTIMVSIDRLLTLQEETE